MRIAQLDLLAYGKFTDHKLPFPKAEHDFHVIVGPNEAGKSTVRRAITELLFGIEVRSSLGFKHPLPDLRLAGVLENATTRLEFIRVKKQKSLRSTTGEVLPETYLQPVLGALREEAFADLHCLDHPALLKGGSVIVDPKNNVSQIIFQAASGLEDFAGIREAISERTNALFAKGGRNNEFTRASDKLAQAQRTLREVEVRSKDWVEARNALRAAEEALEAERQKKRGLDTLRASWNRARRLAPLTDALARLQEELMDLRDVTDFPDKASENLSRGMEQINATAAKLQTRSEDVFREQAELDLFDIDEAILAEGPRISALGLLCGQHPNHARDLPVQRKDVEGWLDEILERSSQFGWGSTEDAVRANLPKEKVIAAIGELLKTRGTLLAEETAAHDLKEERQFDLDQLTEKLADNPEQARDEHLAQALQSALPFKGSEAKQKTLYTTATAEQTAAGKALQALGIAGLTPDNLHLMQPPSVERVTTLRSDRQKLVQAVDTSRSLAEQKKTLVGQLELQRDQFERTHRVVTFAEVSESRRDRNDKWTSIKTGTMPLSDGARGLDAAIQLADELADSRTRSEADSVEAQSLREQHERAEKEQSLLDDAVQQKQGALEEFDQVWASAATAAGLPGMNLDDVPDWLTRRTAAMLAETVAAQRKQEYESERDQAAQARQELVAAMVAADLEAPEAASLTSLCATLDAHNKKIGAQQTLRADLLQRQEVAETALRTASKTAETKARVVDGWKSSWTACLAEANLAGVGEEVADVESAVAAIEFIRKRIDSMNTTRTQRIEPMEADLRRMREAADELARSIDPGMVGTAPEEVFAALNARLSTGLLESDRMAQAKKRLEEVKRQREDADSQLREARRSLEPLLHLAGVEEPELALPVVARWSRKREVQNSIAATLKDLDAGADGFTLKEVQAEVQAHPASQAAEQILSLKDQLDDADAKLMGLVSAHLVAQQAFDKIAGGDKAAVAEAQRQEALAELAQVGEEYLQLATAGNLLKWAIDQYRDRKQGPLLDRASAVFKNLTRGSFEKLRVDYEQGTPSLVAYRPNNEGVPLLGLSHGTRDPLFLALRIAALELQSEQGAPVPFIADDLFINLDDKRSHAGLQALYELSTKTQVIFLSHQEHLVPVIQQLFAGANLLTLEAEALAT